MICVSLAKTHISELVDELGRYPFVEIRLDALRPEPKAADIDRLIGSSARCIATYRPGACTESQRFAALQRAIKVGAAYVDIEWDASESSIKSLVALAEAHASRVIVSYHDYEKTPSAERLREICVHCRSMGADIVKVACKVNAREDCLCLLNLLDGTLDVVPIGMGEAGRITRLAAPLMGAPFTYAAPRKGMETADGQLDYETMAALLTLFEVAEE